MRQPSRWVVSRAAIRDWRDHGFEPRIPTALPEEPLAAEYAALLGFYLGDGCLSQATSHDSAAHLLMSRVYPGIISDVEHASEPSIRCVDPSSARSRCDRGPELLDPMALRSSRSTGPGRKHERPIVLASWQDEIVAAHPWDFLRGLLHSDGARVNNWATRVVAGERRRYDYPRWQFVNASEDILGLCTSTLDLVGVPWRRSGRRTVSVSTRQAWPRSTSTSG